jgi:hypothetical protein
MADKESLRRRTEELAKECFKMIEENIDKAIYHNGGCIDIGAYPEDNALPKAIINAVMRKMADETRPLYDTYKRDSDNLYLFI